MSWGKGPKVPLQFSKSGRVHIERTLDKHLSGGDYGFIDDYLSWFWNYRLRINGNGKVIGK
ncbi:hypothetical protein [Effusibacillus consociatus]